MAAASVGVLLVLLLASVIRGQLLARQLAALKAEEARALEDDGLMAQIETAASTGSVLATALMAAHVGRVTQPLLTSGLAASGEEFQIDWDACKSNTERFAVVARWHGKGYIFSTKQRRKFLAGAANEDTRNAHRQMFDEQDRRGAIPAKTT